MSKYDLSMSNHARFLKKYGMNSAALYYKNLNETVERRASRVTRYCLENQPLPEYRDGQQMIVWGPYGIVERVLGDDCQDYGFILDTDGGIYFNKEKFGRLKEVCTNSVEHYIVDSITRDCLAVSAESSRCRYNHGGVHNVPDFETVLKNGILGYREEVIRKMESTDDPKEQQFEEGLLDVIAGIEIYLDRYVKKLEEIQKTFTGDGKKLERLIKTLKKVPLYPAESFYEAYVASSAVMFFSNSFEPGRLDDYLYPYYEKDLAAGETSYEEAYQLIREMLEDIERRIGHPGVTHVTIGGTRADGSAVYNALTEITIRAIGGLRTPNVSLRVRQDMPQNIWDAFLYNIGKGYAQPAIVNEELYLENLVKDYQIPYEDAVNYAFGGCSELVIQGKTMCDSTWVAYNMLDVFEHALYNHFLTCDTFEEFYRKLKAEYTITLREMEEQINIRQYAFGIHYPWPLQTLFAGDCIENARSYTAGGTRYNFDSANIYAGTNAVNSLYTLKYFYEGKLGDISKETFLQSFIADFKGFEEIQAKCKKVPKFGNGNEELNALAADLMDHVFTETMKLKCYRSNEKYTGRFMPAIILWVDWISCGKHVGATPDGRVAGQATVDSCGPMQGTDTEGPTSVMEAALSLPQQKCISTCVLNLRLDSAVFKTPEGTKKVQQLCQVYFMQGGCQLQINVVDPETLLDAMENPDEHKNLIVRVGGFSDNFVMLSKDIQKEVLKRTQHTI